MILKHAFLISVNFLSVAALLTASPVHQPSAEAKRDNGTSRPSSDSASFDDRLAKVKCKYNYTLNPGNDLVEVEIRYKKTGVEVIDNHEREKFILELRHVKKADGSLVKPPIEYNIASGRSIGQRSINIPGHLGLPNENLQKVNLNIEKFEDGSLQSELSTTGFTKDPITGEIFQTNTKRFVDCEVPTEVWKK